MSRNLNSLFNLDINDGIPQEHKYLGHLGDALNDADIDRQFYICRCSNLLLNKATLLRPIIAPTGKPFISLIEKGVAHDLAECEFATISQAHLLGPINGSVTSITACETPIIVQDNIKAMIGLPLHFQYHKTSQSYIGSTLWAGTSISLVGFCDLQNPSTAALSNVVGEIFSIVVGLLPVPTHLKYAQDVITDTLCNGMAKPWTAFLNEIHRSVK